MTESLVKFYPLYKIQDINVNRIIEKFESLLDTFRFFYVALQNRIFRHDERDLIKNIESFIYKYDELIQEFKNKCENFNKVSISDIKSTIKIANRRAIYPFRQNIL
jgi:hypothetical protein